MSLTYYLLKIPLCHRCFKHFASANQLGGKFSIGGTLVANGLIKMLELTAIIRKIHASLKTTLNYIQNIKACDINLVLYKSCCVCIFVASVVYNGSFLKVSRKLFRNRIAALCLRNLDYPLVVDVLK